MIGECQHAENKLPLFVSYDILLVSNRGLLVNMCKSILIIDIKRHDSED